MQFVVENPFSALSENPKVCMHTCVCVWYLVKQFIKEIAMKKEEGIPEIQRSRRFLLRIFYKSVEFHKKLGLKTFRKYFINLLAHRIKCLAVYIIVLYIPSSNLVKVIFFYAFKVNRIKYLLNSRINLIWLFLISGLIPPSEMMTITKSSWG